LEAAPGTAFQYANDNYNLLAIVVEIASERPFEEFVESELLRPAGLTQTGFWGMVREVDRPLLAEMLAPVPDSALAPNYGFRGATGMYSTAGDLLRWQQQLFAGKVIAPSSVDALLAAHSSLPNGIEVGYGWFRSKTPGGREVRWTRGSESFGHSGIVKVYTDGRVLVVLSSSGESSGKISASRHIAEGIESILDPRE
jgi:CubicO group peptidase (beta-lactamase class C family)